MTPETDAPEADGREAGRRLAFSRSDWITVAAVALVCGLAAFAGVPPLRGFEHDIFLVLSNAYRVSRGQIPHRDFSSALGPLFFLIQAAGLAISGMRPAGIAYANALFGGAAALWMYSTARGRMSGAAAGALAVYAVLLSTAPFSLGFTPVAFSFAMLYNRYCFTLLGIALVECGLQVLRTPDEEAPGVGRGLSLGVAWALLAFLKISYGIVTVPVLALWACFGAGRKRRIVACCGGLGVAALGLLAYLRFDLADMFRDLAYAASGRSAIWDPRALLSSAVVRESVPLLLLAAVVNRGSGDVSSAGPWRRGRCWLFVLLTVGLGGFLLSTNHQEMSLPLDGMAAVVLLDSRLSRRGGAETMNGPHRLLAFILAAFCFLPLALMNAASLGAAGWERYHGPAPTARLHSERGASIVFGPVWATRTSETGGTDYVEALNDGLDLIRTRTAAGDGVMTIDEYNPFDYLLDRPTPVGGMAIAAFDYTFSAAAHPSAARFFGDARWVLVRKYGKTFEDFPGEDSAIQSLVRIYRPEFEQRFQPVEETGHWVLWHRK